MRIRSVSAFILRLLPIAAIATTPNDDAYQAGYKLGQAVANALPYIVTGIVVVAAIVWLVFRARSSRKRSDK